MTRSVPIFGDIYGIKMVNNGKVVSPVEDNPLVITKEMKKAYKKPKKAKKSK